MTTDLEKYGLDGRFRSFFLQTMLWTVIAGLVIAAVFIFFAGAGYDRAMAILMVFAFGGAIAAAFCAALYLLWFKVSASLFSKVFHKYRARYSDGKAAMIAAIVTFLTATIVFFLAGTLLAGSFDGYHGVIIFFGLLSLFVAPFIAWRIYRRPPIPPPQGTI